MRASALVGVSLALLWAAQASAQEKTEEKSGGSWMSYLWPFGGSAKQTKAPPAKKDAPPAVDPVEVMRANELAAMQRRQQVCLKLQEIAFAQGDEELLRRAEELSERAWSLYLQRVGGAPSSRPEPAREGGR